MIDAYRFWRPIVLGGFRMVFRLCGGYRVEGAERVPLEGPVLIAANHVSLADPPALGAAIPRPAWFMAKEPLFRSPVLGWVLRFAHAFSVNQERIDRQAIRRAEEILARGEALAIFPEGMTSPTGELQPFFPGFALIATRARAPVVPAALLGTNRVMPYETVIPRPARGGVTVRFGKPLDLTTPPAALDHRRHLEWATQRVRDEIAALLAGKAPSRQGT